MRLAVLLLACSCAAAEPLPMAGTAHAEAAHLLIALASGDSGPLLAAEAGLFATAPAIPDPDRPGLALRWSAGIAPALARLPDERRTATVAALDQLAQRLLPEHPDLALDLLPAPSAANALAADAERRWDGGDLPGFLALGRALAACARPLPGWSERQAAARQLLHPDPPDPGWPEDTTAMPMLRSPWRIEPGWLLALDPWGRVRWQRPLPAGARCQTGAESAVIRDGAAVQLLDADGNLRSLPPLPGGARCLGVAGGAAWFGLGARTWRVDGNVTEIAVGAEVFGPPLDGRLFLTARELVLDDRRSRHGLPAGPGWHLASDRLGGPLICAPDGRRFRVPPLEPTAEAQERAGRFAVVDALPEQPRAVRWRAALRHGDGKAAGALADGAWQQAVTAWYAGDTAAARPEAPWPRRPEDLALPPAAWDHTLLPGIGAAEDDTPVSVRLVDGRLVAERSGRWRHRWLPLPELAAPGRSQARSGDHWLVIEGDQRLLAFDRATGDLVLDRLVRQAPLHPDRCVLRRRGAVVIGALVLAPPGIDDRLWWIGPEGERQEPLPAPARRLSAGDGSIQLELADGRQLSCDDRQDPPGPWLSR